MPFISLSQVSGSGLVLGCLLAAVSFYLKVVFRLLSLTDRSSRVIGLVPNKPGQLPEKKNHYYPTSLGKTFISISIISIIPPGISQPTSYFCLLRSICGGNMPGFFLACQKQWPFFSCFSSGSWNWTWSSSNTSCYWHPGKIINYFKFSK